MVLPLNWGSFTRDIIMKWTRPSGSEIETNEEPATIEHATACGWKKVSNKPIKKTVEKVKTNDSNRRTSS